VSKTEDLVAVFTAACYVIYIHSSLATDILFHVVSEYSEMVQTTENQYT
jgi:hypothetical protein